MRNVSQKRQKEVSKRALKGDREMWCPEDQEKKNGHKGCGPLCQMLQRTRVDKASELPFIMGAKPCWSRLKSGEEWQPMRKTGHWELCCKEGRDVMVCSRKWREMGCKALAMQHPCTCGSAPVIAGKGRESGVWGDAKVKLRECAVRATSSQWSSGLSAAMASGKEGVESLKRKRMLSIL